MEEYIRKSLQEGHVEEILRIYASAAENLRYDTRNLRFPMVTEWILLMLGEPLLDKKQDLKEKLEEILFSGALKC